MKIRSGFVSNSSSSSFTIFPSKSQELTTGEVAVGVLETVLAEYKADNYDHSHITKALSALKKVAKKIDQPIFIPWTYNYETYIWRWCEEYKNNCEDNPNHKNSIEISTCNNHRWEDGKAYSEQMWEPNGYGADDFGRPGNTLGYEDARAAEEAYGTPTDPNWINLNEEEFFNLVNQLVATEEERGRSKLDKKTRQMQMILFGEDDEES